MKAIMLDMDSDISIETLRLKNVETKENLTIEMMKIMNCRQCTFIPVSSEPKSLVQRLGSTYAITSSGGNMLINGKVNTSYRKTLMIDEEEIEFISRKFMGINVDGTYVKTGILNWNLFKPLSQKYRYVITPDLNGIIIPKNVTKENAIEYLNRLVGIDEYMLCKNDNNSLSLIGKVVNRESKILVMSAREKIA